MRKILTPELAVEIKRLYAARDKWQRPLHTQMEIAKMLGVGETTVYRAIRSMGAYASIPEPKSLEVLKLEAEQSQRRLAARLGLELSETLRDRPLGEALQDRLEREIKEERERREALDPDNMLTELTGESNERRREESPGIPPDPLDER